MSTIINLKYFDNLAQEICVSNLMALDAHRGKNMVESNSLTLGKMPVAITTYKTEIEGGAYVGVETESFLAYEFVNKGEEQRMKERMINAALNSSPKLSHKPLPDPFAEFQQSGI